MATYSGKRAVSAAISANTVDTVVLTSPGQGVQVQSNPPNQTVPVYFTVSEPGGTCPAPTVNGTDCYMATGDGWTNVRHPGQYGSVVQLICASATSYTVQVIGNLVNA